MLDIFDLFARYFWLLALVITAINVSVYWRNAYRQSAREHMAQHPEQARGYHQFLIGFFIANVLVWSVMGFGIVVGDVPNLFAFFDPSAGNPYVLAWHAVLVSLWLVGGVWIFVLGGAQFIVDHPGLINLNVSKPVFVKLWFGVGILGGVFAEILMWTQDSSLTLP